MSVQLDWGVAESADIPRDRFVVNDGGHRLFYVVGDKITFPAQDITVWPWTRLSSIGWVNTNALLLDVEKRRFFTASDEHKFYWSAHLTLRVQNSIGAWETVVRTQDGLQPIIEAVVEDECRRIFRGFEYRSITDENPALFDQIERELSARLAGETPYDLIAIRFEVASDDPAVDEALKHTRRTKALNTEWLRTKGITEGDLQYAREMEQSELAHRGALSDLEATARHAIEIKDAQHRLRIEQEQSAAARELREAEADSDARVLAKLIELFGGDATLAVLSRDPALLSKLAMAKIDASARSETLAYKTGVAEGSIRAINALLRDQDLTDSGQTIRIITESGQTSSRDADDENQ